MKKYALVNNLIVTGIIDIDEENYTEYTKSNHMVVDISDITPQPQLNWILNGNTLCLPDGTSNLEQLEFELAQRKTEFGIKLSRIAIDKIGARNKILNKNGAQVSALLTQLLSIKLLLETGALGTARYACVGLKVAYSEYTDIFDYVISEINMFETSNTL